MNEMNHQSSSVILACEQLSQTFQEGNSHLEVLKNIQLTVQRGESIAIIGRSGSGKSTLLHVLGGLAQPTKGKVWLAGECLHQLSEARRCELRNQSLGFVYQFHHLLPEFTALENVAMPLFIRGLPSDEALLQAQVCLQSVGLEARLQHKPAILSGGERQRVAIARAMVTQPACLLADEPTGNLDAVTAQQVTQLLVQLQKKQGTSLLLVTHDRTLAEQMDRVLILDEGVLTEQ